jgi:ubiquinone/menaquinone biosynthesis C-methylase UbiE
MINWEKEWKKRTMEEKKAGNRIDVIDYWNKRAEDYTDYIRTSNYEHGKKIVEIFEREELLKPNFKVLDIGAGPGSVSIPFAEVVKKVTAIEPASEMVKYLMENAREKGLKNIEVINKKWEEVNIAKLKSKFDIVVCSHAIWLFENIGEFITEMNKVSKKYCCIAEGVGIDESWCKVYKKLGIPLQRFDRFIYLYNILYQKGILANVRIIDTFMRRSIQSAINMYEIYLSKYKEPTKEDKEIIRNHVFLNSEDGIYKIKNKMAVIWWEKDSIATAKKSKRG